MAERSGKTVGKPVSKPISERLGPGIPDLLDGLLLSFFGANLPANWTTTFTTCSCTSCTISFPLLALASVTTLLGCSDFFCQSLKLTHSTLKPDSYV